jgi:hypothetical protein
MAYREAVCESVQALRVDSVAGHHISANAVSTQHNIVMIDTFSGMTIGLYGGFACSINNPP